MEREREGRQLPPAVQHYSNRCGFHTQLSLSLPLCRPTSLIHLLAPNSHLLIFLAFFVFSTSPQLSSCSLWFCLSNKGAYKQYNVLALYTKYIETSAIHCCFSSPAHLPLPYIHTHTHVCVGIVLESSYIICCCG